MLQYQLIRSDRKTVSIEITQARRIIVRAPKKALQMDIDRFVEKQNTWINKKLEELRSRPPVHEPTDEERLSCIDRAKSYLPGRVLYYANQMGVQPSGITITSAKTCFGSCSSKNQLCFSWRLMLSPEDAIDCVVVHELAHIRYRNHSTAFYNFMATVMPDYKERKKRLVNW